LKDDYGEIAEKIRKDFWNSAVKTKFVEQQGRCAYCGRSIQEGFHAHHVDGNPQNNDPENLILLCPDCHYITFKKQEYQSHKQLEREMMETLHEAIHKVVDKELSGSALERILLGISKVLSLSRQEKGLTDKPERIREIIAGEYEDKLREWVRGFKEGVRIAFKTINELASYQQNWKEGEKKHDS